MRLGLSASFMRIASEPVAPMSSQVMGAPALLSPMTILPSLRKSDQLSNVQQRSDDSDSPVTHVGKGGGEREDGHALGRDGDVEAGLEGATRLGLGLTGGDLAKVAVVRVDDTVPAREQGQRLSALMVKAQATHQVIFSGSMSRRANLLTSSSVRSSGFVFVMPSFSRRLNMIGAKVRTPFFGGHRRLKSCCGGKDQDPMAKRK